MSKRVPTHRRTSSGLPRGTRGMAIAAASALCASLAVTVAAPAAQAATPVTLYVSANGNDAAAAGCTVAPGCRTIQRAVNAAAAFLPAPIDATIRVGPGTFAENSADTTAALTITNAALNSVKIVGAGANLTTISPAQARRVIRISGSFPVTIEGVTITGGNPGPATAGATENSGGGILRTGGGNLTLHQVTVSKNVAGRGLAGTAGADRGTGSPDGQNGGAGTAGGAGGSGGGIAMSGGVLTITDSTIDRNVAGAGGSGGAGGDGGDGRSGSLLGSPGAGGDGAAGSAGGPGGSGGGIAFAGTTLVITNSTIVSNVAGRGGSGGPGGNGGAGRGSQDGGDAATGGNGGNGGQGGGVALLAGVADAVLTHVTVAANSTDLGGAAGASGTPGSGDDAGSLVGTTPAVGGQFLSGGISKVAGTLALQASVLANQQANCVPTATSAIASVASDASCFADGSGPAEAPNRTGTSAGSLGALALHGGSTPTAAALTGNAAIGAVPVASGLCTDPDQRGRKRPGLTAPATCTAGAFEPQVPPVAPTLLARISAAHGKTKYNWYRDTVTVKFTCTPGSSPLTAPCPAPMVLAGQGANRGGTVTIANAEGLTSSLKIALNIDRTKPSISIRGVKKGKTYTKPKAVRCAASDSLSGPYRCVVTAKAKLINGNRQVRVNYTATAIDRAGNIRTKKGFYIYNR